jgi:Ca-activated chloride channel homolog
MRIPAIVTAFCMIVTAFAQTAVGPAQGTQQPDQTLSVDVDLVNVVFTVFDRRGRLITNLERRQLTVLEDNRRQEITNFSRETDLPLTVALLVDTSGSIRDKLRFEQEAAIEFFYTTLRRGKDRGVVITFDSGVDLLQDYTDDPEVLANAVRRMRAGGGTALYDALYLAATQKLAGQAGRRVIILISDGDDNSSRTSMTETLEAAQRNDVAIYSISTNRTTGFRASEQERGDRVLKRFSDETGGRMFSPARIQELTQDFLNIGDELRAQYALAYRPTNSQRDGTFRRVRIDVSDRRYQVRARQGYYAPRHVINK